MKKLHLISNAHLDPIWQWEWEEGAAAAMSTFRCAARFCREFDGYIFCHNESLIYRWVEEYEPALFVEIQELVKLGMIYLHGGVYQGKRILSHTGTETVLARGYELKSICNGLAFGKGGMRGQMLLLIPSQDRVVAWTGCGKNSFAEFVAGYID